MKRMLLCGSILTIGWLWAGTSEAAAMKASVDTNWATPLAKLADASEAPLTLARHGYPYGRGCYYGPPRGYRSYWRGPAYGHGYYAPRRRAYVGYPYGHGAHHHGGFGLYIGF
jgi:hypothetical protein